MHHLTTFAKRIPVAALLLPLLMLATSCSRYNADGTTSMFGIIILILDIWAIITIFGKPWSIGKKILWSAIVFFFPIGGLLIYYFFGRNSD